MKTMLLKRMSIALVSAGMGTLALAQSPNPNPAPGFNPPAQKSPNQNTGNMPAQNSPAPNAAERILNTLTTQQFVTDTAQGGMKEVRLSQIALNKSQNQDVKNFAQRMITDHTAANTKLDQLARSKGLNMPAANSFAADDPNWRNPMITGSEQAKGAYLLTTNLSVTDYQDVRNLNALSGSALDIAYAKDMVSDHITTVREFEVAQRNLSDPEIRQFAAQTLPTLQTHSEMAQNLENQLTGIPATTSQTGYQGNQEPRTIGRQVAPQQQPPASSDTIK
jgi:putative membrane protein